MAKLGKIEIRAAVKDFGHGTKFIVRGQQVAVETLNPFDQKIADDAIRLRRRQIGHDLAQVGPSPLRIGTGRYGGGSHRTGLNNPKLVTIVTPLHVLWRAIFAFNSDQQVR